MIKRFWFLLFVLFILSCDNDTRNGGDESGISNNLQILLEKANDDELSDSERIKFASEAYRLLDTDVNDSVKRFNLARVAIRFYNAGALNEFRKVSRNLVELSEMGNDVNGLGRAYEYLGDYYKETLASDSAFYYYNQAEKQYLKLKNNYMVGLMFLNRAQTQLVSRDFRGAENTVYAGMKFINLSNDPFLDYEANNLIAVCQNELKDYENAIQFHKKAIEIAEKDIVDDIYQTKAKSYNNIGIVYFNMGLYDEAESYYLKAFNEPNLKTDDLSLYAMVMDNLAYVKLKKNDLSKLPQMFYESYELKKVSNYTPGLITNKIRLSEYFQLVGNEEKAIEYALDAHKMAVGINSLGHQLQTLTQLSNVLPQNQAEYSREYIRLSDSLLSVERSVSEKFARIEYETEEFKKQREKLAQQNRNIMFGSIVFILLGLLLYKIRDQKNKNEQLRLREAQQKNNEEIYNMMLNQQKLLDEAILKEKKRIAQDLHDGVLGRIFGARMLLDSLNKFDDEEAKKSREYYIMELQNIEQDVRDISHELNREKTSIVNNFVAILTSLLVDNNELLGGGLDYKIDPKIDWDHMPNNIKINIYRLIQESLRNIQKYAKASKIQLSLHQEANVLYLQVFDDGVGFDVDKKAKGIGLINMKSRVESCEGVFEVKSKKGKGTKIFIEIPLELVKA